MSKYSYMYRSAVAFIATLTVFCQPVMGYWFWRNEGEIAVDRIKNRSNLTETDLNKLFILRWVGKYGSAFLTPAIVTAASATGAYFLKPYTNASLLKIMANIMSMPGAMGSYALGREIHEIFPGSRFGIPNYREIYNTELMPHNKIEQIDQVVFSIGGLTTLASFYGAYKFLYPRTEQFMVEKLIAYKNLIDHSEINNFLYEKWSDMMNESDEIDAKFLAVQSSPVMMVKKELLPDVSNRAFAEVLNNLALQNNVAQRMFKERLIDLNTYKSAYKEELIELRNRLDTYATAIQWMKECMNRIIAEEKK